MPDLERQNRRVEKDEDDTDCGAVRERAPHDERLGDRVAGADCLKFDGEKTTDDCQKGEVVPVSARGRDYEASDANGGCGQPGENDSSDEEASAPRGTRIWRGSHMQANRRSPKAGRIPPNLGCPDLL